MRQRPVFAVGGLVWGQPCSRLAGAIRAVGVWLLSRPVPAPSWLRRVVIVGGRWGLGLVWVRGRQAGRGWGVGQE